jgi:hypothetical protein
LVEVLLLFPKVLRILPKIGALVPVIKGYEPPAAVQEPPLVLVVEHENFACGCPRFGVLKTLYPSTRRFNRIPSRIRAIGKSRPTVMFVMM